MRAEPLVDRLVLLSLEEDVALGDVTTDSTIPADAVGVGRIKAKEALVLAGRDVASRVFAAVDSRIAVEWSFEDGDTIEASTVVALARGPVRSLLVAERVALNFLQRLCGVATTARQYAAAVAGTGAEVVDTRKTTPGWRVIEKRAVAAGGCRNHRWSLGSGVLIKDNHVDAVGSVAEAVRRARAHAPQGLQIEIEVRNDAELDEALAAGADIVLLDNMGLEQLRRCAARAKAAGALSEASGGVTLATVRGIAETGVDRISVGALTHSSPSMDLNMKVAAT